MLQSDSAKTTVDRDFQCEYSAVLYLYGRQQWGLLCRGMALFCKGDLHEAAGGRATLSSPVHLGKARSPQFHDALVGAFWSKSPPGPAHPSAVEQLINMVSMCVCAWHHESQLSMLTAAACTRTMHWCNIHKEQQVTGSMLLVAI